MSFIINKEKNEFSSILVYCITEYNISKQQTRSWNKTTKTKGNRTFRWKNVPLIISPLMKKWMYEYKIRGFTRVAVKEVGNKAEECGKVRGLLFAVELQRLKIML